MNNFSILFIFLLVLELITHLWLLRRQRSCVLRHRDRVPSAFVAHVSLNEHQKAADYTRAKTVFGGFQLLFGALLLLLWTLGGGLDLLARTFQGASFDPLSGGVLLILSAMLVNSLLELPLSAWNTFVLEERFGFNRTTPKRFFMDLLLALLLMLLLGVPLLLCVLWLMQSAGELWWLAVWVLWSGFTLFFGWLYPTLIAPLFNRFTPLEEGELHQRICALLKRCDFTSGGVFVMDGSKRSSHGNAYFTGLGKSKRIVFFDTLLKQLTPDQVEAVLAHELGHHKYRHIWQRIVLSLFGSLVGLAVLGWLSDQTWFYSGLGVSIQNNATLLLLFLMAGPLFVQFLQPIGSWLQRRHEFQADRFAVLQTAAEALTQALVGLYRENANTLTPDPLYSAYFDSHPPAPVRIAHLESLRDSGKNAALSNATGGADD